MPKKTASTPTDTLALLCNWEEAARDVVHHVGATRGPSAAYYREDPFPWPLEAVAILKRDTPTIIEYFKKRHALDLEVQFERIAQTAMIWMAKRDPIVAFGKTKHANSDAAIAAARDLVRFTEDGLPEQKRLNLDLRIGEGAVRRAEFPLLAERLGNKRPFLFRRNLIRWAMWIQNAFAEVIREWPLPDENEVCSKQKKDDEASAGWLESQERWELAGIILPRYIPNTDETPKKLAIEESRHAGDLAVALPLIKRLDDELKAFVMEAVRWPQGNRQPSRTERLLRAVAELEELVGSGEGDATTQLPPPNDTAGALPPGELATRTPTEVRIPNRARKAGTEYQQATDALGELEPTDRRAYDQLAAAIEASGETLDLGSFDTWQRNLREYRRLTGQQKHKPKAGRVESTGTLVRSDQIEPEHLPTRIRSVRVDK